MTSLMGKLHGGPRSEAQTFFAEIRPFPFARASITFLVAANMAATVAMLLGQA